MRAIVYLLLVCLLGGWGCAHSPLLVLKGPSAGPTDTAEVKVHGFLFGAVQIDSDLRQAIGRCLITTLTQAKIRMSRQDVVWTMATLALYTPHSVQVTCSKLDSTSAQKL